MGRLPKYLNDEERLKARRLQTRDHVRAFRERERQRRQQACQQDNGTALRRKYTPPQQNPVLNQVRDFFSALLDDFQRVTHVGENYLAYLMQKDELPPFANLIMRSNIANYSSIVGLMKGDAGLQNIANEAYHETTKSMRSLLSADSIMRNAAQLVIMTHDMGNFELSAILRAGCNPHHPDLIPNALEHHARAGNMILQSAEPEGFVSGMGAEVLLSHLSGLIMFACGDRKESFVTSSADWFRVVRKVVGESQAYVDSILPLAFQVPAMMERLDRVVALPEQSCQGSLLHGLLTQIEQLHLKLGDWLLTCSSRIHKPENGGFVSPIWQLDNVKSRLFPHFDMPKVFAPTVDFATHDLAIATSLYWTFILQLAIMADDVQIKLSSLGCLRGEYTGPMPAHIADMICRSFGYWTSACGTINAFQICWSFPHRVAWRWYARQGRKFETERDLCLGRSELLRKSGLHGFVVEYVVDSFYTLPPEQ